MAALAVLLADDTPEDEEDEEEEGLDERRELGERRPGGVHPQTSSHHP